MFTFIAEICPPALQRRKIADPAQPAYDLFPPNKMWRSAFSIHVMGTHLQDCAHLGVADERFRLHAVGLLVSVLVDENRPIEPVVYGRALACLLSFLQGLFDVQQFPDTADVVIEQPPSPTTAPLIKAPSEFIQRMVEICCYFLRVDSPATGPSMVELGLKVLIEAFRRQPSVWAAFTENTRVIDLHQQIYIHSDELLVKSITSMIQDFCVESTSAQDANDFYMEMGLRSLPHVLEARTPSRQFFTLTNSILRANSLLRNDQVRSRNLCQTLMSHLQTYEHTESVELPLADMTMAGLLGLFGAAIDMLRSFKEALNLDSLAVRIFTTLLFPPCNDPRSRPLVDRKSRSIAYAIVKLTCESNTDFSSLLAATLQPMQEATNNPATSFPGSATWQRPAWQCSGLTNLGMTCYMNSLLQQLFANVHFRKFLFDTPIIDRPKQELLYQVQLLFARMQNDYNLYADTSELARVLDIKIENQEDVHGFYEDFLSRLETNMPDESSRKALNQFFSGTLISQIKGECGHVSPKAEPFVDLQMIVKNKANLLDSLEEFVQGEPMEGTNKYKCLSCDPSNSEGRLVNAMRRSCPEKVPDNLTFCLKRFSFEAMFGGESKVNDRFEFPEAIDMSRWNRAHLDDPKADIKEDMFELVGVIVHQGSLQLGHYWSYTLLRNPGLPESRTWVKLEDRMASICQGGIGEVQQECFGGFRNSGHERADNAYVLFYQRKECLEQPISLPGPVQDPTTLLLLPPKVGVPIELQNLIHSGNKLRTRLAGLFDDEFHKHVEWLLSSYDCFLPASPSTSPPDRDSPMEEDGDPLRPNGPNGTQERDANKFTELMSEVAKTYLQRVATCDFAAAMRLDKCVAIMRVLIAAHPDFASCVLRQIVREPPWVGGIIIHSNYKVRAKVFELVLACLIEVSEHDPAVYRDVFTRIKNMHSYVKENRDPIQFPLDDYISFATDLVRLGMWEAASVLDSGYLTWALGTLYAMVVPEQQRKFSKLVTYLDKTPATVSALFNFVYTMMDAGVVIPEMEDADTDVDSLHQITEQGIVLKPIDVKMLTQGHGEMLWMSCSKFADFNWYVIPCYP